MTIQITEDVKSSLSKLEEKLEYLRKLFVQNLNDNVTRRVLHAEVELLRMDIQDLKIKYPDYDDQVFNILMNELDKMVHLLDLRFSTNNRKWYDVVDAFIRFVGVWSCLFLFATTAALPLIFLHNFDHLFVRLGFLSPYYQLTTMTRKLVAHLILSLSGVVLVVKGLNKNLFKKEGTLVFFTHGSSLDAFIQSATMPTHHIALAKQELFLIPFFSWLMTAFGGVPINRDHRQNAVASLNIAVESAYPYDCICIAPEGTRSKTGQILQFKKGPFYLWENFKHENRPIIPLVIFGAFDLYPPGSPMTMPGHVVAHFLDPIYPSEAPDRESMSRLVRQRMLLDIKNCPQIINKPISWRDRLQSSGSLLIIFGVDYVVLKLLNKYLRRDLSLSWLQILALGVGGTIVITSALYGYVVYGKRILRQLFRKSKSKSL